MGKYFEGKLVGNSKGFGFVSIEGYDDDFFIPPQKMFGALDGDKVVIETTSIGANSNLAEVKKILEYANQTVVGNLMYGLMGNYVVCDNPKIHKVVLINSKDLNKANVGDKVVAKVTAQPSGDENLRGEIIEVLGRASERSVLEKAIIRMNNLPEIFPQIVIDKADKFGQEVQEKDKINRTDLTKETIFTIDGDDSKDLDDAISIEKLSDGKYKLGVHIADVGNYVTKDSEIDKEAYIRGTSAYFPGYVIPMLPTSLSNGICSLNENVERLTLSCVMTIDENGVVVDHKIFESVIKSCARLTYDKVFATMQNQNTEEKYQNLKQKFVIMEELAKILEKKKDDAGFLELDLPETYFEINEKGELLNVLKLDRNIAHKMIEAFMIVANETVAEHFFEKKVPFVYRVHEVPTYEKSQQLVSFMEGLGLNPIVFPKNITPMDYQKILKAIDGEPYEQVLNKVLLMSLQKARYCEQCLGHFGLASTYYCHFTSPIRRYPDLTIHRIIKDYLNKRIDEISAKDLKIFVEEASVQSSLTEKRAEQTERKIDALKMAEYMQKHIGEDFDGIICGVTSFGVFVELENTIEGLIRIENLPDDEYSYIENTMTLKGQKHSYGYGEKVRIKVVAVDLPKRQIDFCEANTVYVPRKSFADKKPFIEKNSFSKVKAKFGNKNNRNFDNKTNFNKNRKTKPLQNKNKNV
ncbi:MAG: ribonuclease R [Clostridia bacterium]|nr:ribonuclease R [Clostridia bacterium]